MKVLLFCLQIEAVTNSPIEWRSESIPSTQEHHTNTAYLVCLPYIWDSVDILSCAASSKTPKFLLPLGHQNPAALFFRDSKTVQETARKDCSTLHYLCSNGFPQDAQTRCCKSVRQQHRTRPESTTKQERSWHDRAPKLFMFSFSCFRPGGFTPNSGRQQFLALSIF